MKLFFTQDPEYLLPLIQTLLGIPQKRVFHAIALNFQNILIMTKQILIRFFYKTLSKPIPQWILAVETATLQIYSTVYENKLQLTHLHFQNIP